MDQIQSDALGTLLRYCDNLKERITVLEEEVIKLTKIVKDKSEISQQSPTIL